MEVLHLPIQWICGPGRHLPTGENHQIGGAEGTKYFILRAWQQPVGQNLSPV